MKTKTIIAGAVALGLIVLIAKNQKALKSKPDLFIRKSLPRNMHAMTIPPIGIFIRADHATNTLLLEHELIHWKQYQQLGLVGYYATYASQYLRDGYDKMAMELEARANESAFCKANYTSCVRDGSARTVRNKKFRT